MKSIDMLLDEADELLGKAEETIVSDKSAGYQICRRAIANLYKAYLMMNEQEPVGDLKALFFQCQKINSEFETIEEVMTILADPESSEADAESIIDAANEIWDFIMGILPGVEDEL